MTDEVAKSGVPSWQIAVVWALRVLVGGLFVMSGLVKMIDPWGFLFKLEEYLAVWQVVEPRTIVLIAVFFISGYEFVLGMLLALGCYKRVAPWGLMLMMAVMLPLTLYIWVADPVSDCGCFGEFWVISNAATFWKNVVITAALVLLILWNAKVRQSLFQPAIQWLTGAWITLYILIIGLYGYNIQPLVDFRPYAIGSSLTGENSEGEDDYVFVYEKDGETREFDMDNLPDSTWQFVDRRAVGGDSVHSESIAIYDGEDEVTDEVLSDEGEQILLLIPEPLRADVSHTFTVNEMYEYADSIGVPFVALLGGDRRAVERWKDMAMAEYPVYTAEDTQLKEVARGTMSVVTLKDGAVASKTSVASLEPTVLEFPQSKDQFMQEISGSDGRRVFMGLNLVFGGGLLLLCLCQGIILGIRLAVRKWIKNRRTAKEKANVS